MKNLFKSLMLVAVAAMAFTACTETNEEVNAVSKGTTINFNVSFADETRVSLTDDNEDGVYQAAFEAGDKIVFAAYDLNGNMLTYTDEIILTEEQAADENLTLTANFKSEVGVGSEIKAYVNYYYSNWYGRWESYVNYNYQYAMVDSVDNLNASAELVWNGEEFANIIFKHDNSFGKMTLVADGDVKFTEACISLYDGEGNYKYTTVVDYEQKVNNVFFFAFNGEALNVSTLNVEAYDVNGNLYQFAKEFEPGQFHFKKGRVSKFTIDKWYVSLDMPEVEAAPSVDGKEVVFSWEPVANAAGYEVSVGYNEPTFTQETSCKVSLAGYNPFETVYVYVKAKAGKDTMFMDSQMANASYTVPINKNADGENGYTFVYTQVEERGTNKYKFYNDNEKEYMYVYFEDDITALEPGSYVYSLYDGVNGSTGDSAYRHPLYDNGSYLEFWFQGDFMMFVDVADDKTYTITTFCKRYINDGDHLYKSTWTGKFGGSVEPEPEPEVVTVIAAKATHGSKTGDMNYHYVEFTLSNGDTVGADFRTEDNDYLTVGSYTDSYSNWTGGYFPGYIAYAYKNGKSISFVDANVAYENGAYTVMLRVTADWANFEEYTWTGAISGIGFPDGGSAPEPEISSYTFTSAYVETLENKWSDFMLYLSTDDNVTVRLNFYYCANENFLEEGTYYVGITPGIVSGQYSYISINGVKHNIEGGSVVVAEKDKKYSFTFNEIYYGSNLDTFNGTFFGDISGLIVPSDYEAPSIDEGNVTELTIASIQNTWNGTNECELMFTEAETGYNHVIDFKMTGITPGEYDSANDGFHMKYCKYKFQSSDGEVLMSAIHAKITANGGNSYTYDVTFVAAGVTYHFTYKGSC